MLNVRPWLRLVVAAALSASALSASAAGFGNGGSGAVLGQRLSFNVSFRVDAGDTLTPNCVKADVQFGDRRIPASQITTALEMQTADLARIRVQTERPVDEPVVDVVLVAGCSAPQSRRFVLFADPPRTVPVAAALATPAPQSVVAALTGTASAPVDAYPRAGSSGGIRDDVSGLGQRAVAASPRMAEPRRRVAAIRSQSQAEGAGRRRSKQKARPVRARVAATAPVAAAAQKTNSTPRLELDFAQPLRGQPDAIDAALAAVSEAASATQAASEASQQAASAASARIAALERDIEQMRNEARRNQAAASQWQSRLAAAESARYWLWPLLLLTLVLAALAAWLSWRLAMSERRRQAPWRDLAAELAPVAAGPAARLGEPTPFVTSSARTPGHDPAHRRGTPAWPPPAPPDSLPAFDDRDTVSMRTARAEMAAPSFLLEPAGVTVQSPVGASERTLPYPPNATPLLTEPAPARDVSIEELIDLEQQAEFFVVLGQDEAAIDLLVDHLRETGGSSPLPYLKLLEIHHRRGERDEFERTRVRFNHRFNAYAPEWELGLHSGRALEDYSGVVPRLQQVWPKPLDAMAELEALLFGKSRGDLFDLPAYREVLFLYSLARDLLDRDAVESGDVDLLLPMADGTEFGSTAPTPFMAMESDDEIERAGPQTLPMAPVDVDLSTEPTRPASIFDLLHDTPVPRR
ncbi:MAG: hypothetical protein M3Y32_08135 [Pseudomonadota bacterium]|nr:hypothetical protein [Pseudomonadota bacterium]